MASHRIHDHALLKAPEGDSKGYKPSAACPDIPTAIPILGPEQSNFSAFHADRRESGRISSHRGPDGPGRVLMKRCKTRSRVKRAPLRLVGGAHFWSKQHSRRVDSGAWLRPCARTRLRYRGTLQRIFLSDPGKSRAPTAS